MDSFITWEFLLFTSYRGKKKRVKVTLVTFVRPRQTARFGKKWSLLLLIPNFCQKCRIFLVLVVVRLLRAWEGRTMMVSNRHSSYSTHPSHLTHNNFHTSYAADTAKLDARCRSDGYKVARMLPPLSKMTMTGMMIPPAPRSTLRGIPSTACLLWRTTSLSRSSVATANNSRHTLTPCGGTCMYLLILHRPVYF